MIPIAIKLFLGIGNWLKEAATALFSLIRHHPKEAAIVALLALSAWQYRGKRAAFTERDAARAQTAACITAGQQAQAAQIALNKAAEAKSAAIAKETDIAHSKDLADANAAADRYIAANRVRPHGGSGASKAGASAEDQTAGVHQEMPTDAVMVGAADVRICTAATAYAVGAFNFGQALIKADLAE